MTRWKNLLKIGSLFLILFVVALAPLAITQLQNGRLINKVYTDTLPEEQVIYNNIEITEKIAIIKNSFSNEKRTIIRQEPVFTDKENTIGETVVEELRKLQEMKVMPSYDLAQPYNVEINSKITFMGANNSPQKVVNIREVALLYPNFSVGVWLDDETAVVYELAIFSKKEKLPPVEEELVPVRFMEYLGLSPENISYKEAENGGGYCLYFDENTHFSYRYEQDEYYISYYLDS